MFYEERVVNGVLCSRTHPGSEWVPMTAEVLTAKLMEARQMKQPAVYGPLQIAPNPLFAPNPGPYGWEVTC
jgi:hypothetical protein